MSMGKRALTCIASAVLLSTVTLTAYAAPQDSTDDSSGTEMVNSLLTVQERLDAIEARKGESEAYLSELDMQLTDLSGQLNSLQEQYTAKRTELDLVSQQLTDAEKAASEQRRNMALRIQYMYENSTGNGLLNTVFSADGFQDILTRSENIRQLSEYDRKMLEEYVTVCDEIEEKQQIVEKEQAEIGRLEEANAEKRAEIQTIYEETLSDISEMSESIREGHEEEARILASIQKQEEQLAALLVPAEQQVTAAEQYAQPVHYTAAYDVTGVQTGENSVDPSDAGTAETGTESTSDGENTGSETVSETAEAESGFSWDGPVLSRAAGVNQGPSGKETYYNLNMSGVVNIMRNMGNTDPYWVRGDGVKMLGDYVMVAADLETHPRGSIVESSLGEAIVVDTGSLEKEQLDIAVTW